MVGGWVGGWVGVGSRERERGKKTEQRRVRLVRSGWAHAVLT